MENSILIVDDEPMILKTFRTCLQREGYAVACAESAEEALELLKQQWFAVFFLDLKLPGMNGIELCRKIRAEVQPAVIYAVTGYSSENQMQLCLGAGFDGFYEKPIQLKILRQAARQASTQIAETYEIAN